MDLQYRLVPGSSYEMWARRFRLAQSTYQVSDSIMYLGIIAPDSQSHQFGAPAQSAHELTAFANLHAATLGELGSDPSTPFEVNSDALAQLWRRIPEPAEFTVAFASDNSVQLSWTNQHRGRTIDSTEVYRKMNGGVWSQLTRLGRDATTYTDGSLSAGTYSYFVRHVSALTSVVNDNSPIARPASRGTAAQFAAVGIAPPNGLLCEGNFEPTVDCHWYNAVANKASQLLRDGVVRVTLSGGAVNTLVTWNDSATRGASHDYQVRHMDGAAPGRRSSIHVAVANPVEPENLVCAGTEPTTITCVWGDKEADTVTVERKTGQSGAWTHIQDVLAGVMTVYDNDLPVVQHCYRARHRRGTEYTAYGNEACAIPGDGGPLRPEP